MKKTIGRNTVAILVVLIILTALFVSIGSEAALSPGDYEIVTGTEQILTPPASLRDGEIWTGKGVSYNSDGTITITLAAWGATYPDPADHNFAPARLPPLAAGSCVTIIDDLGDFRAPDGFVLPPGLTESGNTVVWEVDQSDILGAAPATISYTVELKDISGVLKTDYWYTTGAAAAEFEPAKGNPSYWTKEETVFDSFIISMNWNNGSGLNNGMIIDNLLGITLNFGKNSSAEREAPPVKWDTLMLNGAPVAWHLYWEKGGAIKTYSFTIKDLAGAGIDVVYNVHFPNPGGSTSEPAGRIIISEDFFHRAFGEGNPGYPYAWDGNTIVTNLNVTGRIKLQTEPPQPLLTGSLVIAKTLMDHYNDWGLDDTTPFTAKVLDKDTGAFLTFEVVGADPPGCYTYTGTCATGCEAVFSAANPAVIKGIPAGKTCIVTETLDYAFAVSVSYSPGEVIITGGLESIVTVTNTYRHGAVNLTIRKLFDGFPSDWGLNDSTVFSAKIWDVENRNYLIFKATREADGSYRCVGNDVDGLSELYIGKTSSIVNFSVKEPVLLSNLWPGREYRVEEVNSNGAFETVYSANNGEKLISGEDKTVMVTNRYRHGEGNIAICKELDGCPEDWGVDNSTLFTARVKDVTGDNYLLLKADPEPDGSYRCVGNDVNGLSEPYDGIVISEISFSVEKPVVLSNIWPGSEHEYRVEEIIPPAYSDKCTASFSSTGSMLKSGGSVHITVTNTFSSDTDGGGDPPPGTGGNDGGEPPPTDGSDGGDPPPGTGGNDGGEPPPVDDIKITLFSDEHIWYIRGYEDNTIRPNGALTRAEAAMVFFRLMEPKLKEFRPYPVFNDVSGEEWYGLAVDMLAHYDIFGGYADGSFRPNRPITRRELAALVSRFEHLTATDENPYSDLDPNDWAYSYILSATRKGWFAGDSNGRFRPDDVLTRAELVTVMNRVLNRRILPEDIPDNVHRFDDFSSEHWSYADFMESVYTHSYVRKADVINEIWTNLIGNGIHAPFNQ